MRKTLFNLSIFIVLICLGYSLTEDNVVIGIYTQRYFYEDHQTINSTILTYIAQAYYNIGSMAGAQVVPIFSYESQEKILATLEKIDGVIFTGGEEVIDMSNAWTQNAYFILKYAEKQNDQGRVFPILGVCQGLQLMLYLSSDHRPNFLDSIDNQTGLFNTIKFEDNSNYYLLNGVSNNTRTALENKSYTKQGGITYYFHSWGILTEKFNNDKLLKSYWNLYATTSNKEQKFVAYLQAKNYPFYLTMFHPQRLAYSKDFSNELVKSRADLINTIAINFLMTARKSPHVYPRSQLQKNILNNYPLYDSIRLTTSNIYLFNEQNQSVSQSSIDIEKILTYILVIIGISLVSYLSYRRFNNSLKQEQKRKIKEEKFSSEIIDEIN